VQQRILLGLNQKEGDLWKIDAKILFEFDLMRVVDGSTKIMGLMKAFPYSFLLTIILFEEVASLLNYQALVDALAGY
jgi:hypothetical protein